jgi:hypothetical protein
MIKRRKMNTIVNITGITLKCLGASDENDIKIRIKQRSSKFKYELNLKKNRKKERNYIRNNENVRIANNLRRRINLALKGKTKYKKTFELIGCNIKQLIKHLESTFKIGMSWNKRSLIHIDHIRPCASFDLSKPEEQIKCFHYTNLQALWAHENLSKSDKITTIS